MLLLGALIGSIPAETYAAECTDSEKDLVVRLPLNLAHALELPGMSEVDLGS